MREIQKLCLITYFDDLREFISKKYLNKILCEFHLKNGVFEIRFLPKKKIKDYKFLNRSFLKYFFDTRIIFDIVDYVYNSFIDVDDFLFYLGDYEELHYKLILLFKEHKMPFKSKAQQRLLFAKHPEIAEEFAEHTSKSAYKKLPEHVKKAKKKGKTK